MSRRIVIIGGPRVGKTTLSNKLIDGFGIPTLHTSQELERLFPANQSNGDNWSKSSEHASKWFDDPGDWICEGVQMARALRKWLKANPDKPLDADIVLLRQPMVPQRDGQKAMMKGVETVFQEIQGELTKRGARVHKLKNPNDAIGIFSAETSPERDATENQKGVIPRMANKRQLTKVEWEALPEATRQVFTEQKVYVPDGENWKLDADDSEDVTKLSAAIKKERDARAQLEKDLRTEREKLNGVDLEEYNRLKAEKDSKETDELKSKGKIDEIIEKHNLKVAELKKDYEARLSTKEEELNRFKVDLKLRAAAEKGGVLPEVLDDVVDLHRKRVRFTEKGEMQILDKDDTPLDVSVEGYFKEMYPQTPSGAYYYKASGVGGMGTNGNHSPPPNGVDLSKLSATERLKVANRAEAK
jgi:hypothetical protein